MVCNDIGKICKPERLGWVGLSRPTRLELDIILGQVWSDQHHGVKCFDEHNIENNVEDIDEPLFEQLFDPTSLLLRPCSVLDYLWSFLASCNLGPEQGFWIFDLF